VQEFATQQDLAAHVGWTVDDSDRVPSLGREADWGIYRPEQPNRGFLIAYAVDTRHPETGSFDARSGRCLLLAGPWSVERDNEMLSDARRQPWWTSQTGGAIVDLEQLTRWLTTQ
jgi:hypothetical protein